MTTNDSVTEGAGGALAGPTSYRLDAIVIDTETTGFRVAEGHRIVEIATVDVVDGALEGGDEPGWATLVNPECAIPPDATKVHGITNEMVEGAPTGAEVGSGLRFRLGDIPLCFHNADFDLPFLRFMVEQAGGEILSAPVVDTLGLARNCYGHGRGAKNALTDIVARLGLPAENAHRALADARMTARVLIALAGWHERKQGIKTLAELAALSQDVMRRTRFNR